LGKFGRIVEANEIPRSIIIFDTVDDLKQMCNIIKEWELKK
jgi:hypothetical protein